MPEHDIEMQGAYFTIEVDSLTLGYFTGCTGLGLEFDVMEHARFTNEGMKVLTKIAGKAKYGEVVLKRGFTPDMELHDWFNEVVKAAGETPYKTGSIVIFSRIGEEVARFSLLNMWPSKMSVSDLNAGNDEVMIEEFTIVHELIDWV
jgi:phage tail-like protein